MKTPRSRITVAFLLFIQVITLPLIGFVQERLSPSPHIAPYPEHIEIATTAWAFWSVLLAVPFVRLWPVYPGRVPLWRVFRGLLGKHAGTPFVALGHASFALLVLVTGAEFDWRPDLSEVSAALLTLNWLYVRLSIGAGSAEARR
jgi:hypothetical protein